jgi:uncharacterized membrane protein
MAGMDEFKGPKERGMDRILGLSDGIFAFAITLMVLDLVVPAMTPSQDAAALPSLLAGEWIGFLNYFLSFAIIAVWWNTHHRIFEYINGYDGMLKALNLLLLLAITMTPFFTKLLDTWQTAPFAIALYALDQGVAGLFVALTWRHASKGSKFINPHLDRKIVNRTRITSYLTPLLFFVSIPFCFITPDLIRLWWIAILPAVFLIRRKYR